MAVITTFLRCTGDGLVVSLLPFRAVVIKYAMHNYWRNLHNI